MLSFLAQQIIRKYKPVIVAVLAKDAEFNPAPAINKVLSSEFSTPSFPIEIRSEEDFLSCILNLDKGRGFAAKTFSAVSLLSKKNIDYPEIITLSIFDQKILDKINKYSGFLKFNIIVILSETDKKNQFELKKIRNFVHPGAKFILKSSQTRIIDALKKKKCEFATYASREADIFASDVIFQSNGGIKGAKRCGISFKVHYKGSVLPVRVSQSVDEKEICNCLIAILAGLSLKINLVKIAGAFDDYYPSRGAKATDGIKRSVIIDNSANYNFKSAMSVIASFGKIKSARKIVVAGDIFDLGADSETRHRELAREIFAQKPDLVFLVGDRAVFIHDELRSLNFPDSRLFMIDRADEVEKILQPKIQEDDLILISGSKEIGLDLVVRQIMANPPIGR